MGQTPILPNPEGPNGAVPDVVPGDFGGLTWDFYPSPWNFGTFVVHTERGPDGRLTCYAPPGTSLLGDRGLDVARWRRAMWPHEAGFIDGQEPEEKRVLDAVKIPVELPQDFHRWAERETASHVARLLAFSERRPDERKEAALAAAALREELEDAFPGGLERYTNAVDTESLRFEAAKRVARPMPSNVVEWRSMTSRSRLSLAGQLAALAACYGLYRLVRPSVTAGPDYSFHEVLTQPAVDLLLWLYGAGHVFLTFGFLVWVYFRRHTAYDFVRNAIVLAATLAVIPTALLTWPAVYGSETAGIPANALPAIPSQHMAVAILIGLCGALLAQRSPWRLVWLVYPFFVTTLVFASEPKWLVAWLLGAAAATTAAWIAAWTIGKRIPNWRPPPALVLRERLGHRMIPLSR